MSSDLNGMAKRRRLNETFEELPTTIFTVMTNLAIQHGSINLGQGFPDDEGPISMKVSELAVDGHHGTCHVQLISSDRV